MRWRRVDAGERRMAQLYARREAQFRARQSAQTAPPREPTLREFAHSAIDHPGEAAKVLAHEIVDHPFRAARDIAIGAIIVKIIKSL